MIDLHEFYEWANRGSFCGVRCQTREWMLAAHAEIASLRAELATAVQHGADQWRAKDLAQLDADRLHIAARQDAEEIARLRGLLREAGNELSIYTTPIELVERIRAALACRPQVNPPIG